MRTREIPLIIVLSVSLSALLAGGAAAQQPQPQPPAPAIQNPAPSTQGMAPRPAAPTGHRQPRMSDLPPDLAKKESAGQAPNPGNAAIDPSLRICKGC
jgi:hypothetical protein